MDKRRILLIIGFILSVIVFASLLYFFFFRSYLGDDNQNTNTGNTNGSFPNINSGNISTVNGNQPIIGLPDFLSQTLDLEAPTDVARGGLTNVVEVSDKEVSGIGTGRSGSRFYDEQSGFFYSLTNGQIEQLSDQQFFNVDEVTWSVTLDKAILEYPDGRNILYDFSTKKQISLPEELSDFSFDTTGNKIAAEWIGNNIDENWLMIGDSDGSNFQLIEPLGDRAHNVQVDVSPDNQMVALVRRASGAAQQTVLPIGSEGQNFKEFSVSGLNFESKWAPGENNLIYSVADPNNDYKPTLWLTGGSSSTLGTSKLNLQLNTWPSKCTFNGNGTQLYCAEPTELDRGTGLYPELLQNVPDAFYRIDLLTGRRVPLAFPVGDQAIYSAESVFLSEDESILYFVDSNTQRLQSIRLR